MTPLRHDVPVLRLCYQRLVRSSLRDPASVVQWLGAVQAQEFPLAKWGLGVRGAGFGDADVEEAFGRGAILRTHVMRPTWHFVTPADIRWLLALTGSRVQAVMASYFRKAEIDRPLFLKGIKTFERALGGGRALSRRELGVALGEAGIAASGARLAYFTMVAELEAVICSGPRRGKQHSYMLLDERVPPATAFGRSTGAELRRDKPTVDHDEALAELMRRYFTSHGPATIRDCAWWSGLTQGAIRRGIDALGKELSCLEVDGLQCWYAPGGRGRKPSGIGAHLLPIYDEFLIAYQDRSFIRRKSATAETYRDRDPYNNYLMIDGRLAGGWRVTDRTSTVLVAITPYDRLSRAEKSAIRAAANRYATFLDRDVTLTGI